MVIGQVVPSPQSDNHGFKLRTMDLGLWTVFRCDFDWLSSVS